mmetsp:Transcript_31060/g.56294  ORF Transcript_31060/g.56294 Transcript_31060/m.56294 type:complete len:488 (-) Transcript_31060:1049-2512(-)
MSSTQEAGDIFGEGSGPAQMMLRSPTVLIASVGLWGMNVYFFRLFHIDYAYVLNLDLVKEREAKLRAASGTAASAERKLSDVENNAEGVDSKNSSKTSEVGENDDYQKHAFQDDPEEYGREVTWQKLVGLSVVLMVLLHLSIFAWIDLLGGGSIGAVFSFYIAVFIGVVLPLPSTRWLRKSCVIVLQRACELLNPRCFCVNSEPSGPRPIPFVDVFFADAMCSLSKVFFDWGMLFHLASHFPEPVPASTHAIMIPSFCAAIPYIIRARQCLIMHTVGRIKADPNRYQHILNAIKYTTSIFPLCLSAYQATIDPEAAQKWEAVLIVLLVINALYALTWDVVMDWGMLRNPSAVIVHATCVGGMPSETMQTKSCGHALMRPRLRFGLMASAIILLTDALLRFSWTLRFVQHGLFPSKDSFVLATQFLEVFRRAIWNLLRVEWEHEKQEAERKAIVPKHPETEAFIPTPPVSLQMTPIHREGVKEKITTY